MKKFTREEIEKARRFFRSKGFEEVEESFLGSNFSYFVLPQRLEPALPDFVYRCTGEPYDGHVFGISDSVDPMFRPYAVFHEYVEFMKIGIDAPGRCVRALNVELAAVPKNKKPEYVKMRRNFFRNLVDYCSKQPDKYPAEDVAEFKRSLSRLEEIANELGV